MSNESRMRETRAYGKSYAAMIAVRRAIVEGKKVAICTTTPTGEPHVCIVQSINRAKRNPQ